MHKQQTTKQKPVILTSNCSTNSWVSWSTIAPPDDVPRNPLLSKSVPSFEAEVLTTPFTPSPMLFVLKTTGLTASVTSKSTSLIVSSTTPGTDGCRLVQPSTWFNTISSKTYRHRSRVVSSSMWEKMFDGIWDGGSNMSPGSDVGGVDGFCDNNQTGRLFYK